MLQLRMAHCGVRNVEAVPSVRAALSPFDCFLGKDFSTFSLVQNREFILSRMELRGDGKSYLFIFSPFPSPFRTSLTLLVPVLLKQWRLLKETLFSFLVLVGSPQALFFIFSSQSDLTTSHGSPC